MTFLLGRVSQKNQGNADQFCMMALLSKAIGKVTVQ
jgi:hypothetical protein